VVADYQTQRLSLKAHPLAFLRAIAGRARLRPRLRTQGAQVPLMVQVAGVVLIRQRPGSAKGVCFITLEDETGVINLVVWPDLMERSARCDGRAADGSARAGRIRRRGDPRDRRPADRRHPRAPRPVRRSAEAQLVERADHVARPLSPAVPAPITARGTPATRGSSRNRGIFIEAKPLPSAYPADRTVHRIGRAVKLDALRRRRMWTSTVRSSISLSLPQTASSSCPRLNTRPGCSMKNLSRRNSVGPSADDRGRAG
jgi:hypothetical protein